MKCEITSMKNTSHSLDSQPNIASSPQNTSFPKVQLLRYQAPEQAIVCKGHGKPVTATKNNTR